MITPDAFPALGIGMLAAVFAVGAFWGNGVRGSVGRREGTAVVAGTVLVVLGDAVLLLDALTAAAILPGGWFSRLLYAWFVGAGLLVLYLFGRGFHLRVSSYP